MLNFLKYKTPLTNHVKFQRIFMGWLAIVSLFSENIIIVWSFFGLTLIGMLTGTEYSPITLLYKLIKKLSSYDAVTISSHHIRYYQINASVDFIDHLLRIIASGIALILFYSDLEIIAWGLISFLSIFMMLSAYFGFCLSALSYIVLQRLTSFKDSTCNPSFEVNKNCMLAKHCFTPYKRCDSCHVDITQCLGSKFNVVTLIVGLALPLFLFLENQHFLQLNIIFIMGIIFWLGYQINYSTDELSEMNDTNRKLNEKLKEYNLSLEQEVQKRTSEIEHLVIHDQLTGVYNRYWFEKQVSKALEAVHNNSKHYVMAFLDLDKFKFVNDTGGHLAGDALLREITSLITNQITDADCLARLGGDEFAIMFDSNDIKDVIKRCNSICKVVNDYHFTLDEHNFSIGVSIGVVDITNAIPNEVELFRQSDKACYHAKNTGRNKVSTYSESAA